MSVTKVPYGKPVKLLADLQGFPDGRIVYFEIWKEVDQKKEKIAEVTGVTKSNRGIGQWNPRFDRKRQLPLKDKISQQVAKEQYSFIARIDDKTVQGGPMEFTYPIEIYVEDATGQPVNGAKVTVTLSDGSKKTDTLRKGHAKIDNSPAGKFKLELEDHDFIFS